MSQHKASDYNTEQKDEYELDHPHNLETGQTNISAGCLNALGGMDYGAPVRSGLATDPLGRSDADYVVLEEGVERKATTENNEVIDPEESEKS